MHDFTERRRRPEDLTGIPKRPQKQLRVVAVTLRSRQLNWLAEVGTALADHRISRSEIVRAAIDALAERFTARPTGELARYILNCTRDDRLAIGSSLSAESEP